VKKVLIIEDNPKFAQHFIKLFKNEPVIVEHHLDSTQIITNYYSHDYDLIITDLFLPDVKGHFIVEVIKSRNPKQLVAVLTSHPNSQDLEKAFNAGADEFYPKDVADDILKKRIFNLLHLNDDTYHFLISESEDLKLDVRNRIVYRNNKRLDISIKEFDLLKYFLDNKDTILTRDDIGRIIWHEKASPSQSRGVDAHVSKLKVKLGLSCILSVRGIGYRWYENATLVE